jgi:hypothetical protein
VTSYWGLTITKGPLEPAGLNDRKEIGTGHRHLFLRTGADTKNDVT